MTAPNATMLATAAPMARPWSKPDKPLATGAGMGLGAAAGAGAGLAEVAVAATRAGPALEAGGTGAAGALDGAEAGAAAEAIGAAAPLPGGGAPGARVGSLIVGADVGLGGRLMRTVSFFGWTLAASAGLGGMEPPPGDVGIFSAISFIFCDQRKVAFRRCQTRNLNSGQAFISLLPKNGGKKGS